MLCIGMQRMVTLFAGTGNADKHAKPSTSPITVTVNAPQDVIQPESCECCIYMYAIYDMYAMYAMYVRYVRYVMYAIYIKYELVSIYD